MDPIYLDHAATTPVRPEVRDVMMPFLGEAFGNPSSAHRWGRRTAAALDDARAKIAEALGARPTEIHFVRGGTESDNLAVHGCCNAARTDGARGADVVVAHSTIEHAAVREAASFQERLGARKITIPVDREGALDLGAVDWALEDEPAVVSILWVNNEVGAWLPIETVAPRCAERGIPLHTDAVQALGKVPVRLDQLPVSLLTATGHKIYGPKGTGILFVREGTRIEPLIQGGGQERGLRPGTEDVAGAVGMAEAVQLAVTEQESEARRLEALRDRLEERLRQILPELHVHAEGTRRAPHIANVGLPGLDPAALVTGLDMEGVAASAGSACASGAHVGGHVLQAMLGRNAEGVAPLRFSLGRSTTEADIEGAVHATGVVVERLRGAH